MAHEIMTNDVFGEVRVNGKKAWHGLGVEISDGLTADEAFKEIGLDWETELLPIYAAAWNKQSESLTRVKIAGRKLHVRADLMESNPDDEAAQLGVVSDSYKPISNKQLASFADMLCGLDAGITIETAGSLRNGKRVYALCKLPKSINVTDEDVLVNYVLIVNGHDGHSSFECYMTSVRVVCANTLRWSADDAKKRTTFAHTGNVEAKIEDARKALGIILSDAQKFEAAVFRMKDKKFSPAELVDYAVEAAQSSFGDNEAKRDEMVGRIIKNMRDDRQMIPGIEDSAWAAYNAVSQYQDHERGRGRAKVREMTDGRIHSNLFGVSDREKTSAFNKANALSMTAV